MQRSNVLKIDAYSHIVPPKYKEVLAKIAPAEYERKVANTRSLYDLDYRFKIMDAYEPLRQVITLAWPPLEEIADPVTAIELANGRISSKILGKICCGYCHPSHHQHRRGFERD